MELGFAEFFFAIKRSLAQCDKSKYWMGFTKGVISGESEEHIIQFSPNDPKSNGYDEDQVCKMLGKDCFNQCNKTQGECDYCGKGGWCCQKGKIDTEHCDGTAPW